MASFDDVGKAGDAVAAIIAAGIIPAGLEMMDRKATAAVEPFVNAGYDLAAEAILLAESDGTPDEVARGGRRDGARAARPPAPPRSRCRAVEAERLRFWSGRKNAFPAAGRMSPDYYCMDGTIPRKSLGTMLKAHRADGAAVRPQMHERVSCRRWQPAPADPVRCQPARRMGTRRPIRRRHPGAVRAARRHHHRRARRWRGEAQLDVRAVLSAPSAPRSSPSSAPSIRPACSIPARPFRHWRAAPSTAACTCSAASSRTPSCRASR